MVAGIGEEPQDPLLSIMSLDGRGSSIRQSQELPRFHPRVDVLADQASLPCFRGVESEGRKLEGYPKTARHA